MILKMGCLILAILQVFAQSTLPSGADIVAADGQVAEFELFDKMNKTKGYSGNALDWKGQSVNDGQLKNFDTLLTRQSVREYLNQENIAILTHAFSRESQDLSGKRVRDVAMDQETANLIRVQIMRGVVVPITVQIPIKESAAFGN